MEFVTELPFLETEDTTLKAPPRTYSSSKLVKEAQLKEQVEQDEPTNSQTVQEKKPIQKPKIIKRSTNFIKKDKYPCPLCPKEFQNKSGRYNHIKIHHKVKLDFGKVHCLEAGCLFSCMYTTVLQQHLTTIHNIPMKYLNLEFDNYEDFETWKHHFETGEVCRFVKKSGARIGDAGKSMYLYCSRSGTFVSQGKGTRLKKIGSSKISAHCTALIKYFEESSGKVKATVCATHYGHDKDHRFLRLTKLQKRHIAEKMKSGMSRELVLDSIRSTFVNKLDKIHELSKKDLNNIKKSYNIPVVSERKKHTNSSVFYPVDLIKEDWISAIDKNEESPILFYKNSDTEHETLQAKDKCLILMTKGQKDLFLKFCNNGVAYVTTFRLSTMIGLHLTVIFILDDFYEMFPVCFMISTDMRSEMMKLYFNQLFNVVGPISIRALATDDDSVILENWHQVMGPHCLHIIANRHVDTKWRKSLTMVENEAYQGDIYDKLYDFIERAEGTKDKLIGLIDELRSSVNTTQFASYLEKTYLPNITLWSTYYLKQDLSLREPIDFETSHSKLSSLSEISCKYNKTVSTTAKSLIKLLIDCQSTRNHKVAEKVIEIDSAHNASANCSIESVFPNENGKWKVLLKENENEKNVYEVSTATCTFDDCVLMCDKCKSCVHNFYCNCDSYIDGKTCIHVHLVGLMLKKLKSDADAEELNVVLSSYNEMNKNLTSESEQDTEMHSLKSESLTVLEEIARRVIRETDEKTLQQVLTAIKDFQANIDVLSSYGSHAKSVTFVKSSKMLSKTKKKPIKKKVITKRKTRLAKN